MESITSYERESGNGTVIELGRTFEVEMAIRQARSGEVLRLAKGINYFISDQTVKTHLRNIYQKLNATNRRKAVARAINLGIITGR